MIAGDGDAAMTPIVAQDGTDFCGTAGVVEARVGSQPDHASGLDESVARSAGAPSRGGDRRCLHMGIMVEWA